MLLINVCDQTVNDFILSWHWKVPVPVTKELEQVAQSCHKSCSYIGLFLFELFNIISLSESEKLEYANLTALSIQIPTDIYKHRCANWPNHQHHLGKLFPSLLCAPSHFWLEISPFAVSVFLLHLPECWAVPQRCENSWLSTPGSVAELGEMHRDELPGLLVWSQIQLQILCFSLGVLQGISKGIPQHFAGAVMVNAGKNFRRTRTGKVWLCLKPLAGF